ncbi:MAG: hypothetical protein IJX47_05065 [Clostridia bacterium]|nr:hypothetical protein [Clostridia bacterium]
MNTAMDTNMLRQKYQTNYDNARKNALLAIILTAASLVLVAVMEFSFYFSAYIPVTWMEEGTATYKMDNDLYTDEDLMEMGFGEEDILYYRLGLPEYQEETNGTMELVLKGGGAVLIVAAFLVCWFLSKKNPVWLTVMTVLYVVDTAMMVPDLMDYYFTQDVRGAVFLILYHAWILYYLINGVVSSEKLKKLPPPVLWEGEEIVPVTVETVQSDSTDSSDNGSQDL